MSSIPLLRKRWVVPTGEGQVESADQVFSPLISFLAFPWTYSGLSELFLKYDVQNYYYFKCG